MPAKADSVHHGSGVTTTTTPDDRSALRDVRLERPGRRCERSGYEIAEPVEPFQKEPVFSWGQVSRPGLARPNEMCRSQPARRSSTGSLWGSRQITVNTIAPGVIETDFTGGFVGDSPDVNAHLAGMIFLGRVGLPDDVGAAAAELVSDTNGWINGERVEVSGGQNL